MIIFAIATVALTRGIGTPTSIESRVDGLLAELTLREKIELLGGVDNFYTKAISRLGIPRLTMSDGPAGVRVFGPSTAYPSPVALAATWDLSLASKFGVGIGRDARARNVDIWLGPGVDLARVPQCGRNFEYFGEDPLLCGDVAAKVIDGVQSQGVAATIKHYAANDEEIGRGDDNSVVDERTLHELSLRQFEIAIKQAHPWALMASYNRVNGLHSTENPYLLTEVLRNEWGYKGVVMSDWGATHSTKAAALAGLDLEMPGGYFYGPSKLEPLVRSGAVPVSSINTKVRRILRMSFLIKSAQHRAPETVSKNDPYSNGVAYRIEKDGMVLLTNHGILPFQSSVKRILLVGPNADTDLTGAGGSSYTTPLHAESFYQAMQAVAGQRAEVSLAKMPGEAWDAAAKQTKWSRDADGSAPGVSVRYFSNMRLGGSPTAVRTDIAIDRNWGGNPPVAGMAGTTWSAQFQGYFDALKTGEYLLMYSSDDGVRIFVDGKQIVRAWHDQAASQTTRLIRLTAGRHLILVDYYQNLGQSSLSVGVVPSESLVSKWLPSSKLQRADAIIACVGFDTETEGEGVDRTWRLPPVSQMLLDSLRPYARKVVVLLNSGGAVDLAPWASSMAAMQEDWYPGQEGDRAIAHELFGDASPSGRLPCTFPRTRTGTYYASAYPPVNQTVVYREGLLMGYRWFVTMGVKPLFPFGFGLTYTRFKIQGLSVRKMRDELVARVRVTNVGVRRGAEVVQAYFAVPHGRVMRPSRQLCGFSKVDLTAGASKIVEVKIPMSELEYWDVHFHKWRLEPGRYRILAGDSSDSLPLSTQITLK